MAFKPMALLPPQFSNPTNGENASGFILQAYVAQTTTPTNFYSDSAGTSIGSSITLDSGGFTSSSPDTPGNAFIPYLDDSVIYKFILTDPDTLIQFTVDNIFDSASETSLSILGRASGFTFSTVTTMATKTTVGGETVTPVLGQRFITLGYYAAGDNGGAEYIVTNDTANAVNIIDLGSGFSATLVIGSTIKGEQWGLSVDIDDNGPILQAMCDHTGTADGLGRAIEIGQGLFPVETGVTVVGTTIDNFTIRGKNRRRSGFTTEETITILRLEGTVDNFQYATVSGLTFRANGSGSYGIQTAHTESADISDCIFTGNGFAGIGMSETSGEFDVKPKIIKCIFGGGLSHGIFGGDTRVADAWILYNLFLDTTVSGATFGYLDGGIVNGNKVFSNAFDTNGVRGFNLKQPIHVNLGENRFFENGGTSIKLTSPRHCTIQKNQIVGTSDNANDPAIEISEYGGGVPGHTVTISENLIREVEGNGIEINSATGILTDFIIVNNKFEEVGVNQTTIDAIKLVGTDGVSIRENIIDGQGTGASAATRYWLNLDGATNTKLCKNIHKDCVNPEVSRANSPTMIIEDSGRVLNGVVADVDVKFDDDGVIGGVLPGNTNVNLPSATSCPGKKFFARWVTGSGGLILDPAGSQTIDGAATFTVDTTTRQVQIVSNGANWFTI